jgi:hypothetical protein
MKYKQLIVRKIGELKNYLVGQKSLISTNRSREEIFAQIEKIEDKIREIEVLINSEQDSF